jgi:hypothetical protein
MTEDLWREDSGLGTCWTCNCRQADRGDLGMYRDDIDIEGNELVAQSSTWRS